MLSDRADLLNLETVRLLTAVVTVNKAALFRLVAVAVL